MSCDVQVGDGGARVGQAEVGVTALNGDISTMEALKHTVTLMGVSGH